MKTVRRVHFGVVLGILLLLPSADLAAQRPRRAAARVDPMTSSIKGLVTAADTGAPIRGAEIRLSSRGSYNRLVTTDGDGAYRLSDLPAGEYRLTVSRTGYTSLVFGQRRPLEAPTTINLSEGESFTANLALTRGGAIRGRVIDQFGDPIAGTRVQVLRSRMVRGQRRLQSMGPGDQTDDMGEFRVYGLPAGDYYVTASTGLADAVRRDPPLFFPGTPSFSEAQSITLAVGNEAAADFQILPMRSARVSGIVFNASGAPVEAMVQLVSEAIGIGASIESAGPPPAFMINADTTADGRFTIDNVPPGPYVLTANSSFNAGVIAGIQGGNPNAGPPPAMREIMERGPETATMSIVVAGDNVSDLALTTRRGGVLAGSFMADAGVVRPLPNRVSAEVRPAKGGGGPSMMQGGRGSAFRLAGMSGPFYLGINGLPDDWAVSQITVDGVDVTDEPIDLKGQTSSARIVLTDRVTTLSGTVQARGNSSNYSVVVFPDDMNRWSYPSRYVKTARANERGQFRINGLPPNERYSAVAVDFLEEGEEQDPQFLERLRSRAMTFSLREGEQRSIYLDPMTQ
jgi:Carboxypeptidase regulatory-like domain